MPCPDATGYLKMDAMENPFGLPPALQAALGQRLGQLALNRYPGARQNDLKAALAAHAGRARGQRAHSWATARTSSSAWCSWPARAATPAVPAKVLAPAPGFVMYAMCAQQHGLQYVGVDLDGEFQLREQAMLDADRRAPPGPDLPGLPQQPHGHAVGRGQWCSASPMPWPPVGGIVVMDEAYQPFASRSWIDRMRAEPAYATATCC
ncbi:histidinol-phosphate aminotransferase [Alicycliphilus sp. B1]|nr:histidinol-phosphate aminotransferase [Alicycliphilus sp. B1]